MIDRNNVRQLNLTYDQLKMASRRLSRCPSLKTLSISKTFSFFNQIKHVFNQIVLENNAAIVLNLEDEIRT